MARYYGRIAQASLASSALVCKNFAADLMLCKWQSFAIANAKLCIRQRKALHLPTQSFASAHAKHCIDSPQTFAWKRCLHFEIPFPCFPDTWFSLVCFAFPFSWRPVLQVNGRIYAQHILSLKSSNITYVLSHVKESARKTFFQKKTHNSYRYRVFLLTLS